MDRSIKPSTGALWAVLAFALFTGTATAQSIIGPTTVQVGTTQTYEISGQATNVSWNVPAAATIVSSNNYSADIRWDFSGNYFVSATFSEGSGQAYLSVWVQGTPPADPGNPTIASSTCGQVVLQRSGTEPSGVTWYWQTTAMGTSTSYSGPTYTVSTSGTYYLRARKDTGGEWSVGSGSRAVTVQAVPSDPVVDNESRCGAGTLTFNAPAISGTVYKWYTSSGTYLGSGNSFTTPSLSATASYLVEANINSCASDRVQVTAFVTNLSVTVTDGQNTTCGNNNIVLTAYTPYPPGVTSGITHRWYPTATGNDGNYIGGTPQGAASYVTTVTVTGQSKDYWVSAVYNGCETPRHKVSATYQSPTTPTLALSNLSGVHCGSGTYELRAVGSSGGTYQWYDAPSGGTLLHTGGAYSTDLDYSDTDSGSKTFYVGGMLTDNLGCQHTISPRKEIVVQVKPLPQQPTVSSPPRCGPGSVTLAASGIPGASYNWYSAAGAYITSGPSYTTQSLAANTVYQVSATLNGCEGPKTNVTAIINPIPGLASASDPDPRCGPATFTFTASPGSNGNSIKWYTAANGGTLLHTGTGYTTPVALTATTTYYAATYNTVTQCEDTDRAAVTAIVNTTSIWYADTDGDGLGDPAQTLVQCDRPDGYVSDNTDTCPTIYSPSNECSVPGDPQDRNYVYTRTYTSERGTVPDQKFDENGDGLYTMENGYIQDIAYFDGLGRPMQKVGIRQSPDGSDIVTHIGYDGFGRQAREWLPYPDPAGTIGSYRPDTGHAVETAARQYYRDNYEDDFPSAVDLADINPYSEKHFEPSPLDRVLKRAAPGEAWKLDPTGDDHSIEFGYSANTFDPLVPTDPANDNVRLFTVTTAFADNTYVPALELGTFGTNPQGYYPAGELYRTVTRDEDHTGGTRNHTTEEFVDKQGHIILKRTYADIPAMDRNNDGDTTDPGEGAVPQVPHDTYYVYDDYGNLTYVLPPKVDTSDGVSATELDDLCYQYTYDHRNRLVERKVPGKGREYIVYNKLDQPIMTQDSVQRTSGEWLFTKYDAFGRTAYTGKATDGRGRHLVQAEVDALAVPLWVSPSGTANVIGGADVYYDNGAYPNNSSTTILSEVLTINYYDNYSFDLGGGTDPGSVFGKPTATNVKGLTTGSKVKVLDNDDWTTTVTYYDKKGRPVYSYTENAYLGTTDIVETQLDFVGRPLKTRTSHTRNNGTIVTLDNFTYDHVGRLLAQTQCIGDENMGDSCPASENLDAMLAVTGTVDDLREATQSITVTNATLLPGAHLRISNGNGEELIAYNHYDELGQLVRKKVGGTPGADYQTTAGLQTVDYKYNVRGWLTNINEDGDNGDNDLFDLVLRYNDPLDGTPLYNGNIGQSSWHTQNLDPSVKTYTYFYDALNRIRGARDDTGRYDLGAYDGFGNLTVPVIYDKNGNIVKLNRRGNDAVSPTSPNYGTIDNLAYRYDTGNKLLGVTDSQTGALGDQGFMDGNKSGNDYAYDVNGNLTSDANKRITGITYNHLNLPVQVSINSGTISYIYDATGAKLAKSVAGGSLTEYDGDYIYENGQLQFFGQPEGYVAPDGQGGYGYVYQYRDHLGNVRLSYSDTDGNGEIAGANTYTDVFGDGFESAGGWDSTGALYGRSLSYDGVHIRSGSYAGVLSRDDDTGIYSHCNTWLQVEATGPVEYLFSGWVYIEDGSGDVPGCRLHFFMNEEGESGYYTLLATSNITYTKDKWVYLEGKATVPPNIDKINLRVTMHGGGGAATAWFDDMKIVKLDPVQGPEIIEENNFYPFGGSHKGYNNVVNGAHHPYGYNGKEEQDELGLQWLDFGARNYDKWLGRWMNLDPLVEKYHTISPYTYAANNPLYFKDPDGERIWIYYQDSNGDNQRVEYKNGQLYSEDGKVHKPQNDFLFDAMEALDNLGSTKIGKGVLNDLVKSDNNFDLRGSTTSKESTAGFKANKDEDGNYSGGGTLLLGTDQSLETVSHELFHAYQYEKNGDGYSINDEVGAYLFGQAVNEEYYTSQGGGFFPSGAGFGINSAMGEAYEKAYDNLYYSKIFDLKSYESAIKNFKKGAQKNLSGIYNKFPIKPINQNKILISKFYPLVRD